MNETVSIAMATYNGAKYLREQLDSLYAQTRLPDEVVAVDDCSTDGTLEILEAYHQKYGLSYFVNESRLGINLNFGKALSLCRGNYVAICDQDDVWFPEKIEKSLRKMLEVEANKPVLIVSDLILTDQNLQSLRKFHPKQFTSSWSLSILGNARQGCCMFMNQQLLKMLLPIPSSTPLNNLYDFYIAVMGAMCGEKYYLAEPLMYYRVHGGNAVGNTVAPIRLPLAIWIRGQTQTAYEFSAQLVENGLEEIYKAKREYFCPEKMTAYESMLRICKKKSLILKVFLLLKSPYLSTWEKGAVVRNTVLLTILLKVKKCLRRMSAQYTTPREAGMQKEESK